MTQSVSQAGLLAVAIEAVVNRAVEESVPIILEGVHAHPELSVNLPEDTDAITVHTTLAVLKSKELKRRLRGRGAEVPQRRARRYLNTFDSIWSLQTFLLSESDRCDVPNGLPIGRIIYTRDDQLEIGGGWLVFIDLGSADGVYPGQFATIYRENPVQGMPRLVLGELGVLTVEETYSTAILTGGWASVYIGDMVELK